MARYEGVSNFVIRRLPRYYRFLSDLLKNGVDKISSQGLSQRMGLTASQIRQDFNCFGGFGQQGYGYNVQQLHSEIARILGLQAGRRTILLGAGNLGSTIATQMQFSEMGFSLVGIFDVSPALIGRRLNNLTIQHIDTLRDFCAAEKPEAAVLCIPRSSAQEMVPQLIALGIVGFWNFSHYDIALDYPDVAVENVHLGDSLMTLAYQIRERADEKDG